MADAESIYKTADLVTTCLTYAEELDVEDVKDFVYGITLGIQLAAKSRGSNLSSGEIFADPNLEVGWQKKPDQVLGILAGALAVGSEFDEIEGSESLSLRREDV